jgi:hypothetical protein
MVIAFVLSKALIVCFAEGIHTILVLAIPACCGGGGEATVESVF